MKLTGDKGKTNTKIKSNKFYKRIKDVNPKKKRKKYNKLTDKEKEKREKQKQQEKLNKKLGK